jgi:MFS family permease
MGLVAFASASAYLTRYCVSAANTTIQLELGFNDKQMGWILGAFAFGYLCFQVPGGWLGNRFGTRFAFAFISTVWSLCNVWSGAASAFVVLCASRFGLGAFQAGLTPLSAKILKDWIPLQSRGISSALITACMSIGGAFTLWMTGELLQAGYGWRGIFFLYSLVGIVWAVGFYWFFRTLPQEHRGVNQAELELIRQSEQRPSQEPEVDRKESQSDPDPDGVDDADETFPNPLLMFSSVSMWSLCVTAFFRAAGYVFFVTWFFAFLEYVYGIDKDEAGFLTSLPLLAVVIGSLSGGVIVDALLRTTDSKRISRSGTGVIALGICGVLTLASAWTSTAAQLSTVMALGALFSGIAGPASWATTIDLGGKHTAVVMGTMNMAGCLAGVMLPIFLGNWFDSIKQSGGNWDQVIYLHAGFYFVAAAGWIFINPNRTVFEK